MGKAMRFITVLTVALAQGGKTARHETEVLEHRVGQETNFTDHVSTSATLNPLMKRLALLLALSSSMTSSTDAFARVRVLQHNARPALGLPALGPLNSSHNPLVPTSPFSSTTTSRQISTRLRSKLDDFKNLDDFIDDAPDSRSKPGLFADFFKEFDNFVDDAVNRKLGGGSTFYGERKSSFSKTSKSYSKISQQAADKRAMDRMGSAPKLDPLQRLLAGSLSGEQLRNLVFEKWGQQFPVSIKQKRDALGQQRLYLNVQWKYLGKRNLNLSPEDYVAESDAVAELLTEWGVANQVRNAIGESTARPKTMTQNYPALFIALDVEKDIVETW